MSPIVITPESIDALINAVRKLDGYMTTEEAAKYLNVSEREVNRMTKSGLTHYRGMGKGGMRFKKEDLDKYCAQFRYTYTSGRR